MMGGSYKNLMYGGNSYAKDDSFKLDKSVMDEINMLNKDSAHFDIDSKDYQQGGLFKDDYFKRGICHNLMVLRSHNIIFINR